AALVVRALEDEEIAFTFGIPGTHNIELYDALAESTIEPVLVTDEQSASFMADAVYRSSGRLACVNVVPGAGLTHALSGIAEAYLDNVAMLVLGCGIRRDTGKAYQLHDVDQLAIAAPVTKGVFRPETGEEIYATIRAACRLARRAPAGPVFVEIPANLYFFKHDDSAVSPSDDSAPAPFPTGDLDRALEVIERSQRPLLYLGWGARGAGNALVDLAERLEAPVATTFQGKGVFPESHPLALWPGLGAAAPAFVRKVCEGRDAMLAIGCRFGEVATGSYGFTIPGPLVHVDVDSSVLSRNYPAAVGVAADAAAFVTALLPRLRARSQDSYLRSAIAEGRKAARSESLEPVGPGVTPAAFLAALQSRFGPETIYTTDSGNGTFLAVEQLVLDGPGKLLSPTDDSCMGYSVPAAIGAKLACKSAPVVALAGDGAFLMTGLELLTAAHQRAACLVAVLRDGELAQIAQFQQTALSRKTASELPSYDLLALGRALGVEALPLHNNAAIPETLEKAAAMLSLGRPVLLDVAIDYGRKTHFTKGVVKTNLLRLPWKDRIRFVARAIGRKLVPG
ncbi:MAG TPA: thiamine pyrophosphate-binding protein, partial [Thermoanaerobaculia bacterium]|nr:thiamine pyrophosphate-binding protein [Thermoanaerobaculia bacterium]